MDQLQQRINELIAERDQFVQDANVKVTAMNYAIEQMQAVLAQIVAEHQVTKEERTKE